MLKTRRLHLKPIFLKMPCLSHDNWSFSHANMRCNIVVALIYCIARLHSFIVLLFSYTFVTKPNYSKTS